MSVRARLGGLLLLFVAAAVVTGSSVRMDGALQDAGAGRALLRPRRHPGGHPREVEITRPVRGRWRSPTHRAMEAGPAAALAVIASARRWPQGSCGEGRAAEDARRDGPPPRAGPP
ncbi:hypothetical protein GCM10020229_03500 [Kitasatospora albolonga]